MVWFSSRTLLLVGARPRSRAASPPRDRPRVLRRMDESVGELCRLQDGELALQEYRYRKNTCKEFRSPATAHGMSAIKSGDQGGSACWGAHFSSGACPPHFVPGRLHFKNKFCANCRACLPVPLTHIRALSQEQAIRFVNKRTEGFWNIAPASMGGGAYRVVNNTAGCVGPLLVLFREAAPPNIQASMIPEQWANDEGYLCLSVAKGTLVPAQLLRCGQPHASAKRRKVAALPLLPAQLAAMLADSDADTGQAEDLIEAFAAGAPEIGAFAAGAPEVLSPIEAHHVARASGSVVATVRAYPAQQAAAARAVGVQSSLRGGSQGLQDGLEGELHDLLQDVPVQMLHGKEMEELQAWTLDASYGDDEAAASWNEAGDDAGREETIGEAASYNLLRMHNLGSCRGVMGRARARAAAHRHGAMAAPRAH